VSNLAVVSFASDTDRDTFAAHEANGCDTHFCNESLTQDTRLIAMDTPLIAARDIDVSIGGCPLAKSLTLEIRRGERWCVLGPNGSGKTSLLRVLAGMHSPDRGEVELDGRPYAQWELRAAACTRALLPQGEGYAFQTSVRDCVLLGRHPHIGRFGWPGNQDHERVRAAMSVMDVASLAARDVGTLSGGEQQRTRLAALLAQDPALFLLDEPTTHLDLGHQAALLQHLTTLCADEGRAMVFSTHELSLAARFATHALVFCGEGRVRCGANADVLRPDLLSAAFGFPIDVSRSPAGTAFVPRW